VAQVDMSLRSLPIARFGVTALLCLTLQAVTGYASLPGTVGHAARSFLLISVGDATTGQFIADAQVRLPQVERLARTKWNGEAEFPHLESGLYRVQVRALGYEPHEIDIPVKGDTVGVHFELERLGTVLDAVRVSTPVVLRGMEEFEERRKMGAGRFLSGAALHSDRSQTLQYVLTTRFNGMVASGNGVVGTDRQCRVLVYMDGMLLPTEGKLPNDLKPIGVEYIAGIEMHSRQGAPVEYRPLGDYCKVILLWSKW
jgi:hypothetical protein